MFLLLFHVPLNVIKHWISRRKSQKYSLIITIEHVLTFCCRNIIAFVFFKREDSSLDSFSITRIVTHGCGFWFLLFFAIQYRCGYIRCNVITKGNYCSKLHINLVIVGELCVVAEQKCEMSSSVRDAREHVNVSRM